MGAGSARAEGSTEVINGDTDSGVVENPSLRACEADLVIPVPFGASKIRRSSHVGFNTGRSNKVVSLVALGTSS